MGTLQPAMIHIIAGAALLPARSDVTLLSDERLLRRQTIHIMNVLPSS